MRQRYALLAVIILIAAALLTRYLVGRGNNSAIVSETDLQQIEQLQCALDSTQISATHKRTKTVKKPASYGRKSDNNQRPISTF